MMAASGALLYRASVHFISLRDFFAETVSGGCRWRVPDG
jgi:hypothetical protein